MRKNCRISFDVLPQNLTRKLTLRAIILTSGNAESQAVGMGKNAAKTPRCFTTEFKINLLFLFKGK
jgi:hypothetical protein